MTGRKGKEEVAWNLDDAMKMRGAGHTWREIATRYGIDAETAHRRCDPEYADRRNRAIAATVKAARARDRAIGNRELRVVLPVQRQDMNPIPAPLYDTRSLTAVMMGDPHPERSALAMRSA